MISGRKCEMQGSRKQLVLLNGRNVGECGDHARMCCIRCSPIGDDTGSGVTCCDDG